MDMNNYEPLTNCMHSNKPNVPHAYVADIIPGIMAISELIQNLGMELRSSSSLFTRIEAILCEFPYTIDQRYSQIQVFVLS
jgi:precorrin-2 methylase